jgi:hypothetical protein
MRTESARVTKTPHRQNYYEQYNKCCLLQHMQVLDNNCWLKRCQGWASWHFQLQAAEFAALLQLLLLLVHFQPNERPKGRPIGKHI